MSEIKKNGKTDVTLRPVTADDREFLLMVYEASRDIELSMVPWGAEQKREFVEHQFDAQTSYYKQEFPDAIFDLIVSDGKPVGRLYLNRSKGEISIMDITVLAEHRKNGIATKLITDIQKEAGQNDQTVIVYVEAFNPSQNLFRQLGFTDAENDGMHIRLEWHGNLH